ncbi:MAG: TolC family protein [Verrucomicrobiae bacterium]|nr:TolC family protein [Verrucomicrobiae bacterium]
MKSHLSSQNLAGALLLVTGLIVTGCKVPDDLSVLDSPDAVRLPASLIGETYEPKSKAEEERDATIANDAEGFVRDSTAGQDEEKVSPVAESFAKSGPISRQTWWAGDVERPVLATTGKVVHMGLDEIYQRALVHSSQIKVFATLPLIRETAIDEAEGEFDPELYAQSRYDRTHEPTGSVLETGDPNDFFKERGWTFEGGVRKRFMPGTQLSLSQELSAVTNNSEFFTPDDQGRAELKLSVMQPLLRGAGAKYNRTLIQIAKLDAEAGYDEFIRQLETHLMEVNRTYWALYLARAAYQEKKRLVAETEGVVKELESRGNLDSIASQRSRARSALATRKADLVRSELAIKNAESRLRTLVNDPMFVEQQVGELIPADPPLAAPIAPQFDQSVAEALAFRPEIKQAENHLRAADLREYMAKNEKLPTLNAIAEVGVSSLKGDGDWSGAYGDQYDDSEPTWGAGIIASVPWGRKSAKARHLRTELEVRQKTDQLRSTMETVLLEVQIAHREVTTAWPDTKAKWEAAVAAEQELSMLEDRREVESAESGTSLYLEKLLDAQERRALARDEFLRALVVYNSALTNLDRAKGTLLQEEGIGVRRVEDEQELPLVQLVKQEVADQTVRNYELQK